MAVFRRTPVLLFSVLALVLLAYTQSLHAPFISDDRLYLRENQKLLVLPAPVCGSSSQNPSILTSSCPCGICPIGWISHCLAPTQRCCVRIT